jgi:Cu/Zn superoxide dismutase
MNDNTGFYERDGALHRVAFPTANNANPPVNQLLGVNDYNTAVGFYTDGAGNNHGYEYSIDRRTFHAVPISGATSTTAAAINDGGDVAGFFTSPGGATEGFLLTEHGALTRLAYPGASMTQALGINGHREVVGFYQVGAGNAAQTHGFTWTAKGGFKQVDDPSGVGATTVNGVNDAGDLVGFYVDGAGNTDGMLATPSRPTSHHLTLAPMPTGSVTLHRDGDGSLTATVAVTGLTPGSSHTVEIDAPGSDGTDSGSRVVHFTSPLTANAAGAANATLRAAESVRSLPYGSRFVIRLGTGNTNGTNTVTLAGEPIARSGRLTAEPWGEKSNLTGIDVNVNGVNQGPLTGRATIAFDPAAHTLTVTLDATGLTPGAHAAHIHAGSCQSQGAVLYMLMDFQADAHGNVVDQTRTVTGVNSLPATGTWYLNVHQGDSNSIVANGAPALPFRPLLCAND